MASTAASAVSRPLTTRTARSRQRARSARTRSAPPAWSARAGPMTRRRGRASSVAAPGSPAVEVTLPVPRTVPFPVELVPPEGFDPVRLETWPRVAGRLEWVGGRLPYMPPCARLQWVTVADLVTTLGNWGRRHPEFEVGTNEA